MTGFDASDLLGRRVEQRGRALGTVVDVLCDPLLARLLGIEFATADGVPHFLPRATFEVAPRRIEALMPSGFASAEMIAYYRERGASFALLRGTPVTVDGRPAGALADLRFAANGDRELLRARDALGRSEDVAGRLVAAARRRGIAVTLRPAELPVLRHARPGARQAPPVLASAASGGSDA